MDDFWERIARILKDAAIAIVTLLSHVAVGLVVMALPAIGHPVVHALYGDTPPMLVGNFSLVDAVHIFDYAVAFGIMGLGGVKAVISFWE